MKTYDFHNFYCTNCGNKGIVLPRPAARKRERGHLKNLYCIYCRTEYNHAEVTNDQEKQEFLENYTKGVYEDAKNYIPNVRHSRIG